MQKKEPTNQSSQRGPSSRKRSPQITRSPQPPQPPPTLPSSVPHTLDEWRAHWKAQGQPWRTQPEIEASRQAELAKRHTMVSDVEKGIYPFGGMTLSRADIEWLLATHENGQGPVEWSDQSQRGRQGLDLRGADVRGADLQYLPLARLCGGLDWDTWQSASLAQRQMAALQLGESNLEGTHLQRATLSNARLERADLRYAQLEQASLVEANLCEANFEEANLTGAYLFRAQLARANLRLAQLEGTNLLEVKLSNHEQIGPRLSDVQWGTTNLAVADWSEVRLLDDEQQAHQSHEAGNQKDPMWRLADFQRAVRANHQLAVLLQAQGLYEQAARFAYRAQIWQQWVFWLQMRARSGTFRRRRQALFAWLFSWFLFLLAGYGYKPLRSFLAYVLVIAGFATVYYLLGLHDLVGPHHLPGPHALSWYEAFVVSMTAFHGRGFFVGTFSPGDPQALVAAIEAFVGLLLEVTFIATLTQRLFRR